MFFMTLTANALLIAMPATGLVDQPTRQYDAETFYATTSYFGASFSADERHILMTSDASGVYNLYSQPVTPGAPEQLTFSESDALYGRSWFPNDDRVIYVADQGGDELNHVYVRLPQGNSIDLTPGVGHRASFAGWSGDFTALYVMSNERQRQSMDLYRYDVETYAREMIFENPGGFSLSAISRDGQTLALMKVRNNADDDIFLLDAASPDAEPVCITTHEGNIAHGVQGFSPDGTQLFYTSNKDAEFDRLWSYDLRTSTHTLLEEADWDIMYSSLSWTGRYRITGINRDAKTEITITDRTTGSPIEIPADVHGDITGVTISRSERLIAFYVNGDTAPSNLYVYSLEEGTVHRLTDALNPAINEADLVESTVVRYPSFDGLQIPALLYRPHQASPDHRVPAIVWVHGGPGGQSRVGYSAVRQYLANHGYALLAVNNRGSSGYGKTFFHLDDQKHGEDDLQDCIYGRRYLESLPWVDADRIGIMGGSYGGYMVAAALAFEPEAFDVGINIFGVTNWIRTLESIPPWWEDFKEALYAEMGDPATDQERLRRISPLFHAEQINKPLLVVQGANDPRVLQVESDELVEAVRENGVPVEYVLFPDEGHGFSSRRNRIQAAESYRDFLDRYLRH